jgi:hypothetical protein
VKRAATDLEEKFGRTAYGPMSALTAAKVLYEAGDLAGAKTQLQWAIDHGGDDYAPLARVRWLGAARREGLRPGSGAAEGRARALRCAVRRSSRRSAWPRRTSARKRVPPIAARSTSSARRGGMRQIIQFKLDALGAA